MIIFNLQTEAFALSITVALTPILFTRDSNARAIRTPLTSAALPRAFQISSSRSLITETSVGSVRLGMTVARARKALPGFTLSRTTDGEGVALIAIKRSGKTLMSLYAGEDNPDARINERAVIESIEAWDARYHTRSGVHPKLSLQEVEQKYGKLKEIMLSEIEAREYATFANQPAGIQLRVMNENGMAGVYRDGQNRTTRYTPSAYVFSISIRARQN